MFEPWTAAPERPRRRVHPDLEVVTRRINVATERLAAVAGDPAAMAAGERVPLGGAGWLRLDGALVSQDGRRPTWTGRARLYGRGLRLVAYTRVEVEVSAWSASASQLWLRPASRHPLRWGTRRLRRYFELAHLAGDHLLGVLSAVDGAEVVQGRGRCTEDATAAA